MPNPKYMVKMLTVAALSWLAALPIALPGQPGLIPDWPEKKLFLSSIQTAHLISPRQLKSHPTSLSHWTMRDWYASPYRQRWSEKRVRGLLLDVCRQQFQRAQANSERVDAACREALDLWLPNRSVPAAFRTVHLEPFKRNAGYGFLQPYQRLNFLLYPADTSSGWEILGQLAVELARDVIAH